MNAASSPVGLDVKRTSGGVPPELRSASAAGDVVGTGPDALIAAVICSNGLGHFRRTAEILYRVLNSAKRMRALIVCEVWQRRRADAIPAVRWLESCRRVQWAHGIMDPGVTWSANPEVYRDGRLLAWVDRLKTSGVLRGADLVVSDNLPGVLELRPDAVLAGSFLWSTVLEAAHPLEPAVASYVESERALLAQSSPSMLCVADFAMADVVERTKAVLLPWMCPDVMGSSQSSGDGLTIVAVLGGAGSLAEPRLTECLAMLDGVPTLALAIPHSTLTGVPRRTATMSFDYSPCAFASCRVALCRPGMGTIHDCIAYGIPMVCLHEQGNVEMIHNGLAVQSAGLGLYVGSVPSRSDLLDAVGRLACGPERDQVLQRMALGQKDGLARAARWLLERVPSCRDGGE